MEYVVFESYSRHCARRVMEKCILGSPAKVFKLLSSSNQEYMQDANVWNASYLGCRLYKKIRQ